MEVRIKFSADIYIEGESMQDVREKFEAMPLFSIDALDLGAEFGEIELVEDADTYKDLRHDYDHYFDTGGE
jgi:hypothetical protein